MQQDITKPATEATQPTALLIDAAEYARILSIGVRTIWRFDAKGRIPAAIRLGRAKRWRLAEVQAHVEAGMPPRECWNWSPAASCSASTNSAGQNGREISKIRQAAQRLG